MKKSSKQELQVLSKNHPKIVKEVNNGHPLWVVQVYSTAVKRYIDVAEYAKQINAQHDLKNWEKDHQKIMKMIKDKTINEKVEGFKYWKGYKDGEKQANAGIKQDRILRGKSVDYVLGHAEGYRKTAADIRLTRGNLGPSKTKFKQDYPNG